MTIIVNSPFFDPTIPPHSAAYLAGMLKKNGFGDTTLIDANCDLHNYICSKSFFQSIHDKNKSLMRCLEKKTSLTRIERLKYRAAIQSAPIEWKDIERALNIIRCPDEFYDFALYRGAAQVLERYFESVTADVAPGILSVGRLNTKLYGSVSSAADFGDDSFISLFVSSFSEYFDALVTTVKASVPGVVGISCNYTDQLPFTVYLANRLSRECEDHIVVIGGTEVTDLYKNIESLEAFWKIFDADVMAVVGEGESAFLSVVQAFETCDGEIVKTELHKNIVSSSDNDRIKVAFSENINNIGSPDYSIYDLERYWSPAPVLMYSPTRGCYWNKCTFCDYGLNFESPTSPSRQRSTAELHNDLQNLAKVTEHLYLAVDAISPSYLRRFSDVVLENELGLTWSAEVRLDRSASAVDYASKLRKGGCVALSFGFESGNQRILDLIDKGVDLDRARLLIKELSEQEIHVQLMGFTGFPTETDVERADTFSFLDRHSGSWSIAGIGTFVMTPGAIVAKKFDGFGIQSVAAVEKHSIVRELHWSVCGRDGREFGSEARRVKEQHYWRPALQRPFAGGIDTAHSILYFSKFSPSEIKEVFSLPPIFDMEEAILENCIDNVLDFECPADIERSLLEAREGVTLDDDFRTKLRWFENGVEPVLGVGTSVSVRPSGNIYKNLPYLSTGPLGALLEDVFV